MKRKALAGGVVPFGLGLFLVNIFAWAEAPAGYTLKVENLSGRQLSRGL